MPTPLNEELSERELDILRLVATGASNKEIASTLFISANTVKVHLRNIFVKTGVSSRTEAAMYAVSTGIVSATDLGQSVPSVEEEDDEDQDASSVIVPGFISSLASSHRKRWSLWIIVGMLVVLVGIGLSIYVARQVQEQQRTASLLQEPPQRWQPLAPMPTGRYGFAVSVIETNLYAIAGMTATGVTSAVERYSVVSDTWTVIASKPTPVYEVGAVAIGGQIYVPGGRLPSGVPTNILEIYNPYQDKWFAGAPLPVPLSAYAITALEGKMYVIGGWDGQHYLAAVYQYDPGSNEWKAKSPMLLACGHAAAVSAGGKIYVLGGLNEQSSLDANQIYQPNLDNGFQQPWSLGVFLPQQRSALAAASIADTIYIVGGTNETLQSFASIQLDPASSVWLPFEKAFVQTWTDLSLTAIGTRLYGLGGQLSGDPIMQNLSYQAIYTIVLPLIRK